MPIMLIFSKTGVKADTQNTEQEFNIPWHIAANDINVIYINMNRVRKTVSCNGSSENPGANRYLISQGVKRMKSRLKTNRTKEKSQKKFPAKENARFSPSRILISMKTGINALTIAPSAVKRRNKFGNVKAKVNASL